MSKQRSVAYATAGLAAAAILGFSARAEAAACSSYPNPVFISGSSASQPVLQALAAVLGTSVSIIYQNPDSCFGLNDAVNGTASTESGVGTNYLDPVNGATSCTLASPTPEAVDIGVSDVFIETCQSRLGVATPPAGQQIAKINGPIQAMTIAVPTMSNATSISAEAAYVVFGYAGTGAVVPQWNTPGSIFVRPNTSGTLNMIGEAIGLPAAKWPTAVLTNPDGGALPSTQAGSTGSMFNDLANANTSPTVNATIGILSDEAVMQKNATATAGTVKVLPFQGVGQSCGYYPDSTSTRFDKLNVRQGRYDIWGPLHFVVNVDANGYPSVPHKDAAALVLNYFIATGDGTGTPFATADAGTISETQKLQLITAEAQPSKGGVVPWCAMEVMRTTEVGPEASYQSPEPCGCRFEAAVLGQPVSPYCKSCTTDADCKNPDGGVSYYPVCRWITNGNGYCEAR